jgi:hypothetical protein
VSNVIPLPLRRPAPTPTVEPTIDGRLALTVTVRGRREVVVLDRRQAEQLRDGLDVAVDVAGFFERLSHADAVALVEELGNG